MARTGLRGGLVGCGYFARNHLQAWKEVAGADIVALCDRRVERARDCAEAFSVPESYDDLEDMLDATELDFVDVATTPETHRPLVEAVASRGLHVICQKPMAPSMEDSRRMVAACREAGVRFMVHENFRWQVPMRAAREACERIGPLHHVRLSFRSGFDIYSVQPYLAEQSRFIVYDLGVHVLDLARFFAGEIERLYCQMSHVNPEIRGEDVATVMMRSRDGATVLVELSYACRPAVERYPQTLVHLEGRDGTVSLEPDFRLLVVSPDGREERSVPPTPRSWTAPPREVIQDSVFHIQQHWVDRLGEGRDPDTSGEDNLRTLELVFGAYDSAATGEIVFPETAGGRLS